MLDYVCNFFLIPIWSSVWLVRRDNTLEFLISSSSQALDEIYRLWMILWLWIYVMQTQTEMNSMFKQGIKAKTFTGIEFSGYQSISSTQLLVFTWNSIKKWNLDQVLKERRCEVAKLKERNWKFDCDYTVILRFKYNYTNYIQNWTLELQIQSNLSSGLTCSEQLEI
jgi:hypothetical protein